MTPRRIDRPAGPGTDDTPTEASTPGAPSDPAGPDARTAAGPEPEAGEPSEDPLRAAQRECEEYRDLLLRKTAEFDNYRKRVERERREMAEAAAADLIADLLPVLDDLERALQVDAGGDADAYRRGVELIHRQILETLRRRGLTEIEAVGTDFDPHVHEAVVYEPAPDRRDGEVVDELRRGYRLGDRLLRAAMVKVAKA